MKGKSNKRQDRKKKMAAALCLFLAFLMVFSLIAPFLFAAELKTEGSVNNALSISADVGYSGLYKVGYPAPVSVTVNNNTSQTVTGEVQIKVPMGNYDYYSNSYYGEEAASFVTYAKPVNVNANSTVVVDMEVVINTIVMSNIAVSEDNLDNDNDRKREITVELVNGSGNVLADSTILSRAVDPEDMMIATLSDNPENLLYLSNAYESSLWSTLSGVPVNFTQENFPRSVKALSAFNALYINDFDTSRLSGLSLSAISQWVNIGGVLFIGTGENFSKVTKGLGDIVDVQIENEFLTDNLDEVFKSFDPYSFTDAIEDEMLNQGNVSIPADALQNSVIAMERGEETAEVPTEGILDSEEKTSLDAMHYVDMSVNGEFSYDFEVYKIINEGNGSINLLAFDLGNTSVQRSERFQLFLSALFRDRVNPGILKSYIENYGSNYLMNEYEMSTIPAQNTGMVQIIFLLIIIYVIAIGPVLYLILKKKDKREAGFIIIPCMAGALTLIVFGISLNTVYKRPVVNSISKIAIKSGETKASKAGNVIVLSGRKGDIDVEFLNNLVDVDLSGNITGYYYYGDNRKGDIKVIFNENPEVIYSDAKRWQTNILSTVEEISLGGSLDCDVVLENGVYKGNIINNTGYDLKDVVIMYSDREAVRVESLENGESYSVDHTLGEDPEALSGSVVRLNPYVDTQALFWNETAKEDNEPVNNWNKMVRQSMVSMADNDARYLNGYYGLTSPTGQGYQNTTGEKLRILAFIESELGNLDLTVNGDKPLMYSNSMVEMEYECPVLFIGPFTLPYGSVMPTTVNADNFFEMDYYDSGYYVNESDQMTFTYNMLYHNDIISFMFDESSITNDEGDRLDARIFNVKSGEWEELLFSEYIAPEDYFDAEGNLIIQIDLGDSYRINTPWIQVRGES